MKRLFCLLLSALAVLSICPMGIGEEAPQGCISLNLESNPSTGYQWEFQSTDEAVAVGHIFRVDGVEVCQHKLRVGMIAKIGITHSRFELIGPNHIEACLLKAKVKTSATCKE